MKIYQISINLNSEDGPKMLMREIIATETAKSYCAPGLRIDKTKLLRVDTGMYENGLIIMYYVYCLEDQKESAFNLLIEKAKSRFEEIKIKYANLAVNMAILNADVSAVTSNLQVLSPLN